VSRKQALLLASATVICVAALYFKQPQAFHLPQFYAEEGQIFFADAYNDGWKSLFYTANGYFHLVPRLFANLTLTLGVPFENIPAVFVYGCLPIYFLLWFLIFARLALPPEAKLFVALSTVLVPIGNEIFMNQTNVQWIMALIPVVLYCGEPPARAWVRALDHVILILCLFTGPYTLFLFPAFAAAAVIEKQMRARAVFLAITLVATVVCVASLADFGTVDRVRGITKTTWYGYVQLVFRSYFFPLFSTWVDFAPRWLVVPLATAVPVMLLLLGRMVLRSRDRFAIIAFLVALPLLGATFISYGRRPWIPSPYYSAIRNFYLPMVLLLWSLIAITRFDRRRAAAWSVAFGWFAVQIAFIPESRVINDMRWDKYSERLYSGKEMMIPITPPGWGIEFKAKPGRHSP
jgi:hypothetical protein